MRLISPLSHAAPTRMARMKISVAAFHASHRRPAKKIAPEDPAARDEGPRLIPLAQKAPLNELAFNARYLELADIALGEKKSKKRGAGNTKT